MPPGGLLFPLLLLFSGWCGSSSSLSLHRRPPPPMTMMSDWGLPPPTPPASLSGKTALGVDYGTRNVGVGVSAGWSPRPLTVIKHPGNDTAVAGKLVSLARGELAELIVVGMPFDKDGTETFQAQLTRDFARLLASLSDERGGPDVVLVDERFSSAEAQARMQHEKRAAMLARLDAEAACVILEGYFADGGAGAEAVRAGTRATWGDFWGVLSCSCSCSCSCCLSLSSSSSSSVEVVVMVRAYVSSSSLCSCRRARVPRGRAPQRRD